MELNIKREAGTAIEKKQAKTLLPAIERHHLLLVSLLLWNAGANEALPIFMDELVPPFAAIILSITLVLFVGGRNRNGMFQFILKIINIFLSSIEILPAALMTGSYQLWITYYLAPMVYVVMIVFWPLAFPIAWVLDHTLGEEEGVKTFNKTELETVLRIQQVSFSIDSRPSMLSLIGVPRNLLVTFHRRKRRRKNQQRTEKHMSMRTTKRRKISKNWMLGLWQVF